jgi:predicted RNA methylase
MAEEADVAVDDAALDAARAAELSQREKEVDASLRAGKSVAALQKAVENPPFGTKNQDIKVGMAFPCDAAPPAA